MWNVRSPQSAQRRCLLQMQLVSRRGPGGRTCRAMAHARGVWAVHTLHWRTGAGRVGRAHTGHCTGACARRASGAVVWRGSRVSRPSPRGSIEPAGGTPVTPHLASSCGCGRVILASRAPYPTLLFTVVACTCVASSPAAAPAAREPRHGTSSSSSTTV